MSDSIPLTQFTYRSQKELALLSGYPTFKPIESFEKPSSHIRAFSYSKNGAFLAYITAESVKLLDTRTCEVVSEIKRPNVIEVGFSPKGTYISTWERPTKSEDASGTKNLIVYKTSTATELASFSQKSQNNWNLQWTSSEEYCARLVSNEVQFWESANVGKQPWRRLQLENVGAFSLSPGKAPSVAVFIPEKKGAPAVVRLYSIPNFTSPVSNKTFYKADKVEFVWNDLGTSLLVLTHTEVDKTGKSYYGETHLYYLAVAGNFDCRVVLDKDGPIHDVTWAPQAKEFVVVYGLMPSKTTLFDHRANPIHDFGLNPRNFVRFNPQGRLLAIAGFGNLNGTVDFWDRRTLTKVSTVSAANSSHCEWSPDGRYLMTATLTPRLRVDNGFKMWHYTGSLVYWEAVDDLYQAEWKPELSDKFPFRGSLSPAPNVVKGSIEKEDKIKTAAAKPQGAYRPPHLRGTATPSIFKREDEADHQRLQASAIPGMPQNASADALSKQAVRNQKKREAKKKAKGNDNVDSEEEGNTRLVKNAAESSNGKPHIQATNPPILAQAPAQQSSSVLTEQEKKIRNVEKKIRQIAELKERIAHGEKLELTQLQKIDNEASLLKELENLRLGK